MPVTVERAPLVIDTREPDDLTSCLRMLVSLDKIPVERDALDSADYVLRDRLGQTLGIERKTPGDFAASICDGRLDSQLARMCEQYDARALVIHGRYGITPDEFLKTGPAWSMRNTRLAYASFAAKQLSIQEKYACRLLICGTDEEFAVVLRTLWKQGHDGRFHV